MNEKAHKVMTPEEYVAMPIIGWHSVYRDIDGYGAVGIRFHTDGAAKLMQIADGTLDDPADEAVVRDAADALDASPRPASCRADCCQEADNR
jgi:hypothetical protein